MNRISDSRKLMLAVPAAVGLVLLMGCAKVPQQQWDAAKTAVQQAQGAEAATYAEAEWQKAHDALTAAEAEIATQGGKSAFSRSYEQAGKLLEEASSLAAAAQQAAIAGKEAAKTQSTEALAAVNTAVTNANALLADIEGCGKRPKGFSVDVATLHGQLDGLSSQTAGIQSAIDGERYKEAQGLAEALTTQLTTVTTDLEGALSKLGCTRKTT